LPIDPDLAAWLNKSSSSPERTAAIRVSITVGSLSFDGTAGGGCDGKRRVAMRLGTSYTDCEIIGAAR
jgi:hypothetical protein